MEQQTFITWKEKIVIVVFCLSILIYMCIICNIFWAHFDCYMRDEYGKEHYGYSLSTERCLEKRKQEGHWY